MHVLSFEELNRYSRQMILDEVGVEGQQKLKQARVLVIGAGGLGCPVLQYLAAAGIGTIGIIDFDVVEIHNLHRQILYTAEDIGKRKAPTAANRIKQSNPNVQTAVFEIMLNEENAEEIISQFDIVVDGSDNFVTRYLVNDICIKLGKPLVYGSIFKFEGQLAVFNYKGSKNLRDIYPEPPNPEDAPSCSDIGVIGVIPGIVGLLMCQLVFQIQLGFPVDTNTIMVFNFNSFQLQKLSY